MAKIKNVVFDFGGVLLDLNQQATLDAFSELIGEEIRFDNIENYVGSALIDLEKGLISDETFIWKFQHLKKGNLDPVLIIKAWNKMLLGMRSEIFDFLKAVKQKYNCILLSNTNGIHIRYVMYNILEKQHQERDWGQYFHKVFYSHEMHMRKPDQEIYSAVIEEMGINRSETLFIDDTKANVEAAVENGWHAVQHDPMDKIETKLEEYINYCERNK